MKRFRVRLFPSFFAGLLFYFSASLSLFAASDKKVYDHGGIVRGNPLQKKVCLVFTAASWADGASVIIPTLKEKRVKGGFFFTGQFYERFPDVVRQLVREGHYVGSHGYGHLLYCPWENRDSLLVSKEEFQGDMLKSYELMNRLGIPKRRAKYFIPPYEYFNDSISKWAKSIGLQVINFTPGAGTNADYTIPSMKNYRSSEAIYEKVLDYEEKHTLNGHFLLIHFGTHPERTDKFYRLLPKLIDELRNRGYKFVSIPEMAR